MRSFEANLQNNRDLDVMLAEIAYSNTVLSRLLEILRKSLNESISISNDADE